MEDRMIRKTLLTVLLSATALCLFPDQPRANAQETITYWYYQPATAGATRQPRTGNSAKFVAFYGPVTEGGPWTPGANNNVFTGATKSWPVPNTNPQITYNLAFVSITGGAGGDITVFPDSTGNVPVITSVPVPNTANTLIAVNAYYFPSGGSPCPPNVVCGSGADIDEFGELQGGLIDDTFVSVVVPADPALNPAYTTSGNVDGSVATTNYAVSIDALQPTYTFTTPPTATAEIFDRWVTSPGGTIGSPANDLLVGKQTDDYALALYHSSCPSGSTWSSTPGISQCVLNPVCQNGFFWNVTLKKCMPIKTPGPVCHMCAKGQVCTEVGVECNCLRCTPEGQGPQPIHPMVQ
jgi:hypothetical protein